jgi:hypothetical protein
MSHRTAANSRDNEGTGAGAGDDDDDDAEIMGREKPLSVEKKEGQKNRERRSDAHRKRTAWSRRAGS